MLTKIMLKMDFTIRKKAVRKTLKSVSVRKKQYNEGNTE